MANALITRQGLIALKTESTPGTAESLANADGAINCYDPSYTPDITMSERPSQGTYDANLPSVPGARMGRIGFRTDYFGLSTSLWFSRILPHAGFTISSLTATAVGSASTSTATVAYYLDGKRHQLVGAVVSSLQIDFERGNPIYMAVEYVGKYAAITDTALLTPTYPSDLPLRLAGGALTFAAAAMPAFSGNIRIENAFAMRPSPSDATGYLHAQITRQTITAELTVESALEATRDDFAEWLASTTGSLVLSDGASFATTIPGMQRTNVQPGDSEGIANLTIPFLHTGSSAASIAVAS